MSTTRLALAAVVLLSAQGCGSSPTPAPSGPTVLHVVLGNAPRPISLSVVDRSGLVIAAAASDGNVPMNLREQADFDKNRALVRAGSGETSVTVLWRSGTCTPNQSMLITPAGNGWTVQIDLGPAVGDVCDLMLIGLAVTITASVPLDATRIHALLGGPGA